MTGKKYVGQWKKGYYDGQGTLTYADGEKYVGEWKDDQQNGQGTLTFPSGEKYVGEFKDDQQNGQGTLTYADGEKYVGEFKDGYYDGQGTFTWTDARKYVGEWKDGKKNGQGFYIWQNGNADFCDYVDDNDTNCMGNTIHDVAPALRRAFVSLSEQQRKESQNNLKKKGYYESTIDGLWGRTTFTALVTYAAIELKAVDVQSSAAARFVITAIVLQETAQDNSQPSTTGSCFSDQNLCSVDQLCYMATDIRLSSRVWSTTAVRLKYVDEAKKRGLSCDVQVQVATPKAPDINETYKVASGTGFYVSADGHIITNYHVIDGCKEIKIHSKGQVFDTVMIAKDPQNDLALLKSDELPATYFSLSRDNPYALQDVIVAGFPFGDRVSSSLKFTQGIVSSVTGIGNNYSEIQIDAALQPGNSGGPIMDEYGNVMAVAVSKLDMKKILDDYGVIPENTNFGVKASAVRNLMEGNRVEPKDSSNKTITKYELSELATDGTVFLTCWMTTAQIDQLKTRKVMFNQFE